MAHEVLPAVAPDAARAPAEGTEGGPHRFALWLAAIVLLGVGIRIVYIVTVVPHTHLFPDSLWYYAQAFNLRDGRGYVDISREFGAFTGHPDVAGLRKTAYWPPLYPVFLAVWQALTGESVRTAQLAGAASGAASIMLTGLLGRSIAGRAVGLLGALLVALSPFLIAVDGSLMSETLYLPLALLALLLAQHARTRPTAPAWCALGAVIGLAALTRGDAVFLVVVALIPAAVLARAPARELVPRVLLGLGVMVLVVTPWIVRNAIEVDDPTISTISANGVLAGANCPRTYHGPALGYWRYDCMRTDVGYVMSEAEYSDWLRRRGVEYAVDHVDRWPAVAAARVGRVWGVWDPRDQTRREAIETRDLTWQRIAWPISLATLAVGLVGFWVLARQRRPIALLVAPVVMATVVALASYGNPRFRTAAEPALLIGVAAALLAGYQRLRRTPATSPGEPPEGA